MKRAALYIRVSTMEQAKEGYSIPAQTEKLKSYASAKDMAIFKTYTDPGYSGAKLDRPALQEMIRDIEKGKIDTVLVYKLDRLARSQKITLYLIEDVFLKNNVDFVSLQESFDTSTPFGRATIGMLSVFAQLERDTITERMHMGRTERAKQGYYHGSGVVPIGYDYVDGDLIINEYEATIIREIFDLYVNQGKGQVNITKQMVKKYPDKVKTVTLIKYALRNPLYIGKVSWEGNVYDGHHEPIIDEETFAKAQRLIKDKAVNGTTNKNQQSLLAGLIYCGKCGAKVTREISGSTSKPYRLKDGTIKRYNYQYKYYTCRSVKGVIPSAVKDWDCNQKRIRCNKVDEVVINTIKSLDIPKVKKRLRNTDTLSTSKLSAYQKEIAKKENEKKRILDLYQFGTIDVGSLNERLKSINESIQKIQDNIEELDENISQKDEIAVLNKLSKFDWDKATVKEKIKIIKQVVERVELKDSDITVTLKF